MYITSKASVRAKSYKQLAVVRIYAYKLIKYHKCNYKFNYLEYCFSELIPVILLNYYVTLNERIV